jgi:hypothetical protein
MRHLDNNQDVETLLAAMFAIANALAATTIKIKFGRT